MDGERRLLVYSGPWLGWLQPQHGNDFAALGNVGGIGTLSQTFADTAGQQYQLNYFLASNGSTPNEFQTFIDGNQLFDQVNNFFAPNLHVTTITCGPALSVGPQSYHWAQCRRSPPPAKETWSPTMR